MTDQTGGQTPPGWYPDGSGATRYWDGTAWTEHVQPAAPAAPPAPAAPVEQAAAQPAAEPAAAQPAAAQAPVQQIGADDPLAGTAAPYAGAATAAGQGHGHGYGDTVAPAGPTPFYKKWPILLAIVVALVLVAAGAVFALGGSDDDDASGGTVPSGSQSQPAGGAGASQPAGGAATTPQTATGQFDLNCEPTSKIPGSNNKFPFGLTLTTTPDAAGNVAISLSADKSISNNGPTEIEPDRYRFEASVLVNEEPFQLIGPVNKDSSKGEPEVEDIFKANELPLVATLTKPAPAGGVLNVVVTDLWFNNINNGVVGTDELDNTFDSRCNTSPTPNASPVAIGLSIPAATTP